MSTQKTKIIDENTILKSESTDNINTNSNSMGTKVLKSFDQAVASSEELSETVTQLESASRSQTSGVEEVSQSLQSIASAIQGVAKNATKAMEMMRQSEEISKTISADAEKGMNKMDSMKSIVSESSNDVKKLAVELSKVDNMTGFITQIAEQTNLQEQEMWEEGLQWWLMR